MLPCPLQALEYPNAPDDAKVNFGKLVLDAAFARWRAHVAQDPGLDASRPGEPGHPPPGASVGGGNGESRGPRSGVYYREPWPRFWQCAAQPAVVCSTYQGVRWRQLIGEVHAWCCAAQSTPSNPSIIRRIICTLPGHIQTQQKALP